MQKVSLIGIIVVLLVLGSLTNVVGYQVVQSHDQKTIKEYINQKELLFQTILDIANNKEIKQIISISEMKRMGFFNQYITFSTISLHILTKDYLNFAYHVGLIFTKTINISKIHSLLERYQARHQEVQKEITAVIEKNDVLNKEIKQLSDLQCDCKKDKTAIWSFPVICTILYPLFWLSLGLHFRYHTDYFLEIMGIIGSILNCFWMVIYPKL